MPCTEPTASHYADFERDERKRKEYEGKINSLTRMLCDATKVMEEMSKGYVGFTTLRQLQEYVSKTSPELVAWWKQHKKDDAKRLQSETKKPVKKKRA